MYAFMPSVTNMLLSPASISSAFHGTIPSSFCTLSSRPSARIVRMVADMDDKKQVKQYFNTTGFERWNRIYSETDKVNKVQLDIRKGHAETVSKVLKWIDDDGNAYGLTICDAGCGVGSLTLPLLERGARVTASDISHAMVNEAEQRVRSTLPDTLPNVSFSANDLESITGNYNTVCCIDVIIHYQTDHAIQMIRRLAARADQRLIISFSPNTFLLSALKKVGQFFPGPSKTTRAYLHQEYKIRNAIEQCGMKIARTDFTGSRFYFTTLLEAVRE